MKNFEGHIENEKPVLIEFSAGWSGLSRLMRPVMEEVKEAVGQRANVLEVDVEQNQSLSSYHNIISIPTLILFQDGNILWRKEGVASANEILSQLALHLER